jgi:hypothetical protein
MGGWLIHFRRTPANVKIGAEAFSLAATTHPTDFAGHFGDPATGLPVHTLQWREERGVFGGCRLSASEEECGAVTVGGLLC